MAACRFFSGRIRHLCESASFRNDLRRSLRPTQSYKGLAAATAVIPVMLFLATMGRRLLQLRIAGMVAEINLARTPDGIQAALRRALDDPSLEIYLWSREHERYVVTDGRSPVAITSLIGSL